MTSNTTTSLSGEVGREAYQTAVSAMDAFLRQHAGEQGWCSERHRYFEAILPEYDRYADEPDFGRTPEDGDYATLLRDMRARVLWYVRAGQTTLDVANAAFQRAGLPQYPVKDGAGTRYTVYLGRMEVNVSAAGDDDPQGWLESSIRGLIRAALDGQPFPDSRVVPGSAAFQGEIEVYRQRADRGETVAESDTLRPAAT